MKRFITFALLAISISVSAQEVKITSSYENLPESMTFKEMTKMQYKTANSDIMHIEMTNGAEYDVDVSKIQSQTMVTRNNAAKNNPRITKWLKEFNSLDELNEGDVVGILTERDLSTTDFINEGYGDLYGLETIMVPYLTAKAEALAVSYLTSVDNIKIHDVVLAYVTKDIDGQNTIMTERIDYPYCDNRNIISSNIFLENHYTCVNDYDAPSTALYATMLSEKVLEGYMFVGPDYRGFGTTSNESQLYIDIENNGRNGVDGIIAAKNYADLADNSDDFPNVNLAEDATVTNAGISQGASTAMGVTYYMENVLDKDLKEKMPKISETRICAGALDLKTSIEKCFETNDLYYPPLLALIISTATVSRPDIMMNPETGEKYTVHDYFVPELRTRTWDTSDVDQTYHFYNLPGENTVWQMLYSKKLDTSAFTAAFTSEPYGEQDGSMFGHVFVDKVLAEGIMASNESGGYKINPDDPRAQALAKFGEINNLCDNNLWIPESNIYITHDTGDEIVPYANTEEFINNMYYKMLLKGHILYTKTTQDCGLAHFAYCIAWIMSETTDFPMDTCIYLIKTAMSDSDSEEEEEE